MHPGDRFKSEYDVFLSFAGKDTRLTFTAHLYQAFIRRGIRCFEDDVDLPRGEDLNYLFQAIQNSLCAVLIISENYANSKWCLKELAEILESRKNLGRKVFPVFYNVDPSDVEHQRGSFGVALAKHEKSFKKSKDYNKPKKWREALAQVSNLRGWVTRGRNETEVIQDIVKAIWNSVFSNLPSYGDNLVGVESRTAELINSQLEMEADDDIRFVGIWGMRGVGKTTLARLVFEKISDNFQLSYFISNVRENSERKGLVSLQKDILSDFDTSEDVYDEYSGQTYLNELFCNRKVLLVLDDVSHVSQLERLASLEWFGKGSRVIITTTNSHLLVSHGVHTIYVVEPMGKDESLKLFCKKAFKKDHPDDGYFGFSEMVVKYTGGIPLALNIIGSFLYGRSLLQWEETLERMKQYPDKDVLKLLEISYDGLNNDDERTIFLDIACFFNGWERDEVVQILKNCDLHPTIGIDILIERALLVEMKTLDGDIILEVHDLLQELARSIVLRDHLRRRSRLWNLKDIDEMLKDDKGSEAIQAIALPFNLDGKIEVHHEAFSKMDNLRLLIISSELKLSNGLKCFSSALKVIRWRSYPLETLPIENHLYKLVEIQMPFGKIKHWNGMQLMEKLKFIDLSNSRDMVETPDFSKIPNLEKLNLEGCSSLIAVHDSLGELKRLVELNLSNCMSLEILPKKLEMDSLTKFDISWCKKLSMLPEFGEGMKKLTLVDARKTAITKLPKSLGYLTGLKDLNLRGPRELVLEMSVLNLTSLTTLDLSKCGIRDGSIPEDLGGLSSLVSLNLDENNFSNLPSGCFSNLVQLLHLHLNDCEELKSLPKLPPRLVRLEATGCRSMEPLSSDGMWNLVSTLDHEYRHRTNCEKRVLPPIQSEYVPEADFLAILPESEIPSWFRNRGSISINNFFLKNNDEYEFEVDIPTHFRASKWCGLVVCLTIEDKGMGFDKLVISWSCKAHEDYYVCKEWENEILVEYESHPYVCLMLLDFNEKTCWQHLRANNNRLHIKLRVRYKYSDERVLKLGCGWRALCEEEIGEWGNKLTEEMHNSYPELSPQRQDSSHKEEMQDWGNKFTEEELPPLGQGDSHNGGSHGGRNVNRSSNHDSSGRLEHNKKVRFCGAFLRKCNMKFFLKSCGTFFKKCYKPCTTLLTLSSSFSSRPPNPSKEVLQNRPQVSSEVKNGVSSPVS